MITRFSKRVTAAIIASLIVPSVCKAQVPDTVAAADEAKILEVHAEGAQIYECKADTGGKLVWQFREPVATLILDGKTIGRHYAGPSWELEDGSAVVGKVIGKAPGTTSKDIPWLKLNVSAHRGSGQLGEITTVQRINTKGGTAEGLCDTLGNFLAVPYSSDYVFLKHS